MVQVFFPYMGVGWSCKNFKLATVQVAHYQKESEQVYLYDQTKIKRGTFSLNVT